MERDINKFMPKIHGLQWGALINKYPTNERIKELDRLLPHNGKWHEVQYGDEFTYVNGVRVPKKTMGSMT